MMSKRTLLCIILIRNNRIKIQSCNVECILKSELHSTEVELLKLTTNSLISQVTLCWVGLFTRFGLMMPLGSNGKVNYIIHIGLGAENAPIGRVNLSTDYINKNRLWSTFWWARWSQKFCCSCHLHLFSGSSGRFEMARYHITLCYWWLWFVF